MGPYYLIGSLRMLYSVELEMVDLQVVHDAPGDQVLVPPIKRGVGAPRKKRIRTRENAKLIVCSKCKKPGHHNAKTCTG